MPKLIFDKGTKAIQQTKYSFSQKMVLELLDIYRQKQQMNKQQNKTKQKLTSV